MYPLHVHLHGVFVNRLVRLHEGDFDVINEHSPLPPVVGTRLPIVTSVHSPMRSDSAATRVRDLKTLLVRLQTPVSRHIETGLFRRSARITTVARWVAEALTKGYGVDAGQVTVTGNGVEDRFFSHAAALPRQPFVLYAGRVEVGKGLEELVMAARLVGDSRPALPLRFVIAGSGPLLPKIQGLVAEMGLADRFQFTGQIGADRREELVQLYRTAGIFTLPSYHEGMSTVMLEAMAAGAPVISTAVGGGAGSHPQRRRWLAGAAPGAGCVGPGHSELVGKPPAPGRNGGQGAGQGQVAVFLAGGHREVPGRIPRSYPRAANASLGQDGCRSPHGHRTRAGEVKPLRVAVISAGFESRSLRLQPHRSLLEMGRQLAERGHQSVLISNGAERMPAQDEIMGLPVYRLISVNLFRQARQPGAARFARASAP